MDLAVRLALNVVVNRTLRTRNVGAMASSAHVALLLAVAVLQLFDLSDVFADAPIIGAAHVLLPGRHHHRHRASDPPL